MKTKQIRHYRREHKLKKMELQEQELDEEVYSQQVQKGFQNTSNIPVDSQGKVFFNTGCAKNSFSTSLDTYDKLWERNKYGFPRGLGLK